MISSGYSFKLISHKRPKDSYIGKTEKGSSSVKKEKPAGEEIDDKKRSFMKVAGVVGVGALAATLVPRKAQALVFGSTPTSNVVGLKDSNNNKINPAKEDGNLATVATQSGLLTFDSGSAAGGNLKVNIAALAPGGIDVGLQNASNVTINPAMEDGNLATVKANTATIATNTAALAGLTFSSGALVTTTSGGTSSAVSLKDTTNAPVNPSTEDSVVYLRRIVKLMESQAVVDSGNRQRITLDSLGTGTAITTAVPVSGTVAIGAGAAAIGSVTLGAGTNAIGSITAIDGQNHQMFQDFAKTAYATGIRQNLVFQ